MFLVLLPQLRKNFPNLAFDDEVSLLVLRNAGLVDDDQMLASKVLDETGCGIDHQGGTSDDQQIGLMNGLRSLLEGLHIQGLFIEGHIRLDHTAAVRAIGHCPRQSKKSLQIIKSLTV